MGILEFLTTCVILGLFFVILGLDPRISVLKNSKISYYVILGLDPRISVLRNSGIPYRDCPVKPDNDTELRNSRIPIYLKVI